MKPITLITIRLDKVNAGFAASARCIFVYKNHPALRAMRSEGKASELGFPFPKNVVNASTSLHH
jgi:hypothetical protein